MSRFLDGLGFFFEQRFKKPSFGLAQMERVASIIGRGNAVDSATLVATLNTVREAFGLRVTVEEEARQEISILAQKVKAAEEAIPRVEAGTALEVASLEQAIAVTRNTGEQQVRVLRQRVTRGNEQSTKVQGILGLFTGKTVPVRDDKNNS